MPQNKEKSTLTHVTETFFRSDQLYVGKKGVTKIMKD
jgi:hypothetical protein